MSNRALLVGLNHYPNPANLLRGCINDVGQVRSMLVEHYGFRSETDLRVLTDARATTGAIKAGLRWLVAGAEPGDVLVFHYSGHGSQVRDANGDETSDGLDEIICPYDLDWDNPFTDDDLHEVVKDVSPGVNFTVILDCCHAGTGLRERALGGAEQKGRAGARGTSSIRCLAAPPGAVRVTGRTPAAAGRQRNEPDRRRPRRFGRGAAEAGAVLIAACRDDQVSADAYIDGDFHGALTFYLCRTLEGRRFSTTYEKLIQEMRRQLAASGFDQVPQLEGPAEARQHLVFSPAAASTLGTAGQPRCRPSRPPCPSRA